MSTDVSDQLEVSVSANVRLLNGHCASIVIDGNGINLNSFESGVDMRLMRAVARVVDDATRLRESILSELENAHN